jgi:hypothetical protein
VRPEFTAVTTASKVNVSAELLDAEAGGLLAALKGACGRDEDFVTRLENSLRAGLTRIAGRPALRYLLDPRGQEKALETRNRSLDTYASLLRSTAEGSVETRLLPHPPIVPRVVVEGSAWLIYRPPCLRAPRGRGAATGGPDGVRIDLLPS